VLRILTMGMVEVHRATAPISAAGRNFEAGSFVIPMRQPYAAWAQALLEVQNYPDLRDPSTGAPLRPYDVTAHTLPLLMGIEAVPVPRNGSGAGPALPLSPPIAPVGVTYEAPPFLSGARAPRIGLYRGSRETIPAGWTRWLLDSHEISFRALSDADLRAGRLNARFDVILFQDQSAGQISEGWRRGQMPPEFTGGLGSEGTSALRQFVQAGGRLVAIESATDFAISTFDLPVRSRTSMLPASAFYIPGSILGLDVDVSHRIGRATPERNIAWFGAYGRAFDTLSPAARVVARYGAGDPRLSGWALGIQHVAAQPAIVEVPVGRGSVVLFGFQPNYRGQSVATWPLLFNAIGGR
jgi:hypothetical protein